MTENPSGPDVRDWIDYGIRQGWVTEACLTHDGIPSTPEEDEQWEDGSDPCQHLLRLWPDGKPPAGSPGEREHLRASEATKVVGHRESTSEFVADGNIYRVLRIDPVYGRDSDSDGLVEDGQTK